MSGGRSRTGMESDLPFQYVFQQLQAHMEAQEKLNAGTGFLHKTLDEQRLVYLGQEGGVSPVRFLKFFLQAVMDRRLLVPGRVFLPLKPLKLPGQTA